MNSYFVVSAPGLEDFTALELGQLFPSAQLASPQDPGFPAITVQPGGVEFKGDLSSLYQANLHLRTPSRILARLGTFFHASTFEQLEQRSSRLPWERFIRPGQPLSLRVTCHHSRLYHSDAVGRTVAAALADRLGQTSPVVSLDEEAATPPQLVVVRLADDRCTISIDSSGVMLHKRGYRQAVAKAPLRETLAAVMLIASGWEGSSPLVDPFCGSGTIPIEAALLALGIPPGINRRFAFMDWPGYDPDVFQQACALSPTPPRVAPPILGSDRDLGAIRMARENAARAGVEDFIEFKHQAVSSLVPPPGLGHVVTNPPYGARLASRKDLRDLYARFGTVLRSQCPGWQVAVLCSDPVLLGQLDLTLDATLGFTNGGLRVRLARGRVPSS